MSIAPPCGAGYRLAERAAPGHFSSARFTPPLSGSFPLMREHYGSSGNIPAGRERRGTGVGSFPRQREHCRRAGNIPACGNVATRRERSRPYGDVPALFGNVAGAWNVPVPPWRHHAPAGTFPAGAGRLSRIRTPKVTCNMHACMHAYDDVYDAYDASDTCDEWCILMVLKIGDVGIAMYTEAGP